MVRAQRAPAPLGVGQAPRFHAPDPPARLWLRPRLVQTWRQLVIGGSNKEIAQRTFYSEKTVRNNIAELYRVLGFHQPRCRPGERKRGYNPRVLTTLWGTEIMHRHPEAFKR